jgi:3-isopropylmalate dehydrogenase
MINPLAAIYAAAMMVEFLGEEKMANAIITAIQQALLSGKIKSLSAGKMGLTTTEVGDLVASLV